MFESRFPFSVVHGMEFGKMMAAADFLVKDGFADSSYNLVLCFYVL